MLALSVSSCYGDQISWKVGMTRTAADLVSGVATLDEFPGLEDVEGGGCAFRQALHDVADAVFDERDFEEVVAEDVDNAERVGPV
jgi:hypothetical protein